MHAVLLVLWWLISWTGSQQPGKPHAVPCCTGTLACVSVAMERGAIYLLCVQAKDHPEQRSEQLHLVCRLHVTAAL